MPISKPFKLIFVHIPKVAGTSIERYLGMGSIDQLFSFRKMKNFPHLKSKFDENSSALSKTPQHMTALELKELLPGAVFDSYYKFAVVRNPYDKMVAEYLHVRDTFIENGKEFKEMTLNEFVKNGLNLPQQERIFIFDGHLETQCSYIYDNNQKLLVDKVFRLDNFQECIDFLKGIIKIEGFPHARKSNYENIEQLNDESKEIIKQFYKVDFELLGYKL